MTIQTRLVEGKVSDVTHLKNNKWLIVRVRGKPKPLGVNLDGFEGPWPVKGDRISVEATEGDKWFFAKHRSLVITRDPQPHADYITAPRSLMEELERLVLARCREIEQVSSDDVHDDIIASAGPGYSPKIVGMVFGSLARKRKIHKVGRIKTRRPEAHAREITMWEATRE